MQRIILNMEKWILNSRQRYDLEILLVGGFSPLTGFLSQTDYENVLTRMRTANNEPWPIPINLDVDESFAQKIAAGDTIELCDSDNILLARMTVTDKWKPEKSIEAQEVFGTLDKTHPAVSYLFDKAGDWYLGGPINLVQLPPHYDFIEIRHTPSALKQIFSQLGWKNIIGFQTRNPLHRAHFELMLRAAEQINGNILIHPVVGLTKPADIDYLTRVRCYKKILPYFPSSKALLSLLPLAMRMAGPREALWHAIIRKNYGCTHFIIGRDHAGPGKNINNKPFYDPYAAQDLVNQYQNEIGIKMIPFEEMVYVKERQQYSLHNEIKPGETALTITGTELRTALITNEPIPSWFSFPEVIQELKRAYPAKHQKGYTVFFTGLSGAGKTTLARALMLKLMSYGKQNVTLFDGDIIRRILTNELGFSKAERDLNIQRIGFIASEITKVGGIALCAAIAPYLKARLENRQLISQYGGYIEVYVSTPLSECARRDTKGLYGKALNGEIQGFTGVSDPYEQPSNPEVIIDTSKLSIESSVEKIIEFLCKSGYLKLDDSISNSSREPIAEALSSF